MPGSPPLREALPADFESLWQLDQQCFTPEIAYSQEALRYFLARPGTFTLLAEGPEGLTGFILTHLYKQHGHIITIDVRESHRRTGLGSHLLRAAEERLRTLGREAVVLEVAVDNLPAITFYKRHGYSIVKTIPRYYANGVDALLMSKSLAPRH